MKQGTETHITDGGQNIQVALTDEGISITVWKKTTLTQEQLEELRKDNAFAEYMQKCIQKEWERRMEKYVQECHQVQEHIREND